MKILVDAVLFQLGTADSDEIRVCARVVAEMARVASARDIGLTILDRGGLPDLGEVKTIQFPSYKAENSVADGEMLERMGRCVRADAFVSTALTMLPSLPVIQILFGESEPVVMRGRKRLSDLAECEIALAFASDLVFASPTCERALRSCFPHRAFRSLRPFDAGPGWERRMAEITVDAAVASVAVLKDAERNSRFLALRRMQAAFELSYHR